MTTSERHLRQTGLSVVGAAGQEALRGSTVLVAGCGALGTVAAELLAEFLGAREPEESVESQCQLHEALH